MAASGRPTPHNRTDNGERPRYKDRDITEFRNTEVNPFLAAHLDFGMPLIPAKDAWTHHGKWADVFGREAPLHVELGCGNGFYLEEFARTHPDYNVIGLEIRYKRTVRCARKIVASGLKNVVILRYHAAFLDDLFMDGELSGMYVNHPDPWPKERHEKNRLISRWFLEDVARLLKPGSPFQLKSDYHDNVTRVAGLLEGLPFTITGQSTNIDETGAPWPVDIETHYQRKMKGKGETIAAIELIRG